MRQAGYQTLICLPLVARGQVMGTLDLAMRAPDTFEGDTLAFLQAIGQQIGLAVDNARLHAQAHLAWQIAERRHISQELQDGVLQHLYGLGLALQRLRGNLPEHEGDLVQQLDATLTLFDQAIHRLRDSLLALAALPPE
jgi:two-component system nitrate/nitrite sensor histidine kinase NarX